MKALTVCEPFASLIMLPDTDERAKRVENRNWHTSYRGKLLIHAGKSRDWLDLDDTGTFDATYDMPLAAMTFGAIIGVVDLVDCFAVDHRYWHTPEIPREMLDRHPWLKNHRHVEGRFCFVLQDCRRFETPITFRGAQGIFNVPDEIVSEELQKLVKPEPAICPFNPIGANAQ